MSKLRILSGLEVCTILENYGFLKVRRKGSHLIMQRKHELSTIKVPVPDHDEIFIGTLLAIIR